MHRAGAWGGGREEGKLAVLAGVEGERGVSYHLTGEPGQRWKNLSSAKPLMWEEMRVLFARLCAHSHSGEGWESWEPGLGKKF